MGPMPTNYQLYSHCYELLFVVPSVKFFIYVAAT
jgi:hypothetical protein